MTFTWFISQVGVFWSTLQIVLGLTKLMKVMCTEHILSMGFSFGWSVILWLSRRFFVSSSLELFKSTTSKLPFYFFLFLLFDCLFYWGFSFELAFPILLSMSKLQVTGEGPINPCNHELNHVHLLCGNYSCANLIAWGDLSGFKQIQGEWSFQKY